MSDFVKLAGLWKRQGTKREFLSGSLDTRTGADALRLIADEGWGFIIFRNENKKSERSPDWELYASPPRPGQQQQREEPSAADSWGTPRDESTPRDEDQYPADRRGGSTSPTDRRR